MKAEYRWVVDPIDGTVNYFFGLPHAAVSIALEHCNRSVVGVIYDPFTDELWTVIRGGPTRLNGKIVRVSVSNARIEDAVIAMGFSKSKENLDKSLPHLNRLARRAKKIRILGSAALELAYVACGRLDLYVERTHQFMGCRGGRIDGRKFRRRILRAARARKIPLCDDRRQRPAAPQTQTRQPAEINPRPQRNQGIKFLGK
jgi:myo-inositol-1(or 4)-monophosphatase